MLTGRITYGMGQALDAYGMPVASSGGGGMFQTPIAQSAVAQTPIAQWGGGEWFMAGLAAFVLFSVFTTTRRGVGRARGYLAERRKRLSRRAEAEAEYYRA